MPAGASQKREHEFKTLKTRFKQEHRYPGREEEVAARIVNKQRSQYAETREARQKDKGGKSPDSKLPLKGYEHLTIPQVAGQLDSLSTADLRKIRGYESRHKNRKGMLALLDRRLASG